jgi:tRNA-Thr(GGU) m(6)t(6)A37 methyltransferase TsaA
VPATARILQGDATPVPPRNCRLEVFMSGPSLACPLEVIGIVRSSHTSPASTPIQSSLNRGEHGAVEVHEPFVEGLAGLADFDYVWLVTWLHRPDSPGEPAPLTQVPFLLRPQERAMGIFATRGPRRVNPIGLSLVRVLEVAKARLRFAGVDLLDGTPVIDIKPYVTRFDRPDGDVHCGWFDTVPMAEAVTPADLRPPAP